MATTIVAGCLPMPLPPLPADAPNWNDVPHPPPDDDGYVVVIHVIKFKDDHRREEMAAKGHQSSSRAQPRWPTPVTQRRMTLRWG